MSSPSLLKLMYLVSPALPVGAYAYSQGQEFAIDDGWLNTQEKLEEWISGLMQFGLANLDLPCLIRLYQAWESNDLDSVQYWNRYLLASRESAELLLEDEQMGLAMSRLLDSLNLKEHSLWNNKFAKNTLMLNQSISYSTLFAYCGVVWSIPIKDLLQGFVAAWLENQVAAATKTIPLGQSQAQILILKLHDGIPVAVDHAFTVSDDTIGASLPGLAMASAKHERQYSRLFRS